jgi:hypothetical protein
MTHKQNKLEELRILPVILNIILFILFLSIVLTFINPFVNPWHYERNIFLTLLAGRIFYFAIILSIYINIRKLMKNKLNKQNIFIKLINRFRIIGLLLVVLDILQALVWIFVNLKNLNRVISFFASVTWYNSIFGIILLSLAEIMYLALKYKEENDLTV